RRGRRAGAGKTHRKQRVGFQQRTVGVGDLIGATVEDVESIELDAPAIVEAIAELSVQEARGGRYKSIVLGQRAWTEIAVTQACEPAGLFAEPDSGRRNHVGRARNVVARRIAELRLRET